MTVERYNCNPRAPHLQAKFDTQPSKALHSVIYYINGEGLNEYSFVFSLRIGVNRRNIRVGTIVWLVLA
jgi:hypothetical protein